MPSREDLEAVWAYPKDCLWVAPANFDSKHPMESLCKEKIVRSNANAAVLSQFFQGTLEVDNIQWRDFFLEFANMRVSFKGDLSRVREWYRQLDEMRKSISEAGADEIR